jgi:hypothetical protein
MTIASRLNLGMPLQMRSPKIYRNALVLTLVAVSSMAASDLLGCSSRGTSMTVTKRPGSNSPVETETPAHFMSRILKIPTWGDPGLQTLDMSEDVYSADLLDALYGKGCFTAHKTCIVDHLLWAKICGCRYFPEDHEKKDDPLCGCPAKLEYSDLSVSQASANSADVSALLKLDLPAKVRVGWHLILTPKGWRIDDVGTPDIPSLKARELSRQG